MKEETPEPQLSGLEVLQCRAITTSAVVTLPVSLSDFTNLIPVLAGDWLAQATVTA